MGSSAWAGRFFLGPWWLVYAGVVGPAEHHRHHAVQVVLVPGIRVVDGLGERGCPTVIPADQGHALRGNGTGVLVYIDPEATAVTGLGVELGVGDCPVERPLPLTMADARALVASLVGRSAAPARHPAVAAVLHALADDPAVPLAELAEGIGLSPDRLRHVFTAEVGIPLRAYRRWVRLLLAVDALHDGASLTEAAHRTGFADVAHLHRTFRDQFGLTPGPLLRAVDWVSSVEDAE